MVRSSVRSMLRDLNAEGGATGSPVAPSDVHQDDDPPPWLRPPKLDDPPPNDDPKLDDPPPNGELPKDDPMLLDE